MDIIATDFESFYSDTFSLSKMTTEAYIRSPLFEVIGVGIKINDGPSRWFPKPLVAAVMKRLPWDKVAVLCHNTAFDGLILSHHYGVRPKLLLDTMSMAKPFHHADIGVSLLKLAAHYECGLKGDEVMQAKGKRFADFAPDELARYGEYCCNDCDLTYDLFHKLKPRIPNSEIIFIDRVLRTFTEPKLVWDKPLLELHHEDVLRRKRALTDRVSRICTPDALSSNAKFLSVLEKFGGRWPLSMMDNDAARHSKYMHDLEARAQAGEIKPYLFDIPTKVREATPTEQTKGITGDVEVWALAKKDEEFLALQEIEDDELQAVIAARLGTKSTIAETRAERMIEASSRGSFPIALGYYAAHTGRIGGKESSNVQNFPKPVALTDKDVGFFIMTPDGPTVLMDLKDGIAYTTTTHYKAKDCTTISIRHALKAPPGHRLVVADASQIEARIVAWLAGQDDLVEAFRNKEDIYSLFASEIYGTPINKKDHPVERFVGKTSILGLGFGTGAAKLQSTLAIGQGDVHAYLELPETQRIVDTYRKVKYPMIPKLWKQHTAALEAAFEGSEFVFGRNGLLRTSLNTIWLPNGMPIIYPGLKRAKDGFEYWGKKNGRYQWVRIYGAKATENTVQALARICVSDAWVRLSVKWPVAMQVHDELVACVPEELAQQALSDMIAEMRKPPKWAPDLPLDAEGDVGVSYSDAK